MNDKILVIDDLPVYKETNKQNQSLLERIKKASSDEEIQELLKHGSSYKKAKIRTLKKWVKAATLRHKQLESS